MVTAEERFHAKIKRNATTGCWLWTGSIRPNGYSQFRESPGKNGYGHRFAYEHYVGPVPEGSHLHHTCENRLCVNPKHLEVVTPIAHVRANPHHNANKTRCKEEHRLTGRNVYVNPTTGKRTCRLCQREWQEAHREERRTYAREYWRERYRNDPAFAERHRAHARQSQRRRRAEQKTRPSL